MTTWRSRSPLLQVRRSSVRGSQHLEAAAGRRLAFGSGVAIFLLLVLILSPASAQYNPQAVFQTCPNTTAISQAAGAQLITGVAGQRTYICGLFVLAADAENVSLVGGTGTVCATGIYAIIGGSTAANGPNLLAGGSFTLWSHVVTIAPPSAAATGDNVCLLQSGTGRVSGVVTWKQY